MRNLLKIEFYKVRHDLLVWLAVLICILSSIRIVNGADIVKMITKFPGGQYAVFVYGTARQILIVVTLLTAFLCAADFSAKTIQNFLSVGIDRRKYYLSRLIVIFLLVLVLYAACWLTYMIASSIWWHRVVTFVSAGELAVMFLVALLQLWTYCSLANMIGFFVKKQAATVLIGVAFISLEYFLRSLFLLNGIEISSMDMLPLSVMLRSPEYAAAGRIYDFSFWVSGLYSTAVIVITSAAGYFGFIRRDI